MTKRCLSFFFVSLATIMVVVNVIVPRRYLCNSGCSKKHTTSISCKNLKYSDFCVKHGKGCKGKCKTCSFKEVIGFPPIQDRHESRWLDWSNNFGGFIFVLFDMKTDTSLSFSVSSPDPPPYERYSHSQFISSVKGLRAPPMA